MNKVRFMKNKIEAVKAFHTAFKLGHSETPKADLGFNKNTLRFNLMKEENEEYLEAANNNDLVEVADALGDFLNQYDKVRIIGGCCGTNPEHIKSLRKIIDEKASSIKG